MRDRGMFGIMLDYGWQEAWHGRKGRRDIAEMMLKAVCTGVHHRGCRVTTYDGW